MRWQTTVVVAVLCALVGGFYVYDVEYLGPAREERERQKNRVWTVGPKDVDEVILKRAQDMVRLKRSGGGWQMLEPVPAPGARGAIDDVVTSLVDARMDREVAAAPGAVREFGLDKPAVVITLKLTGKGEPLEFGLGSKNPTGAWVYAKKRNAPAVFLVSEGLLRDATKAASEFRDRTILAFDRKDVTAVQIVTPADTIGLERTEPRTWRITKPVALPADGDVVSDFVDKLQFTKVKDFVAESPRSLAPYGLDRPTRVQLVIGKDKDRSTKTLLFGRVDKDRKGVYAMRPGEGSVLLLEDALWTQLPKNVAALRDKVVVAFDRDKLARLEIESPKGAVTLVRQGDRWRITAPQALPGDSTVLSGLLFQLKEMKAQAFLPDVHFTPTVKVSLWEGESKAPKVLTLAPSKDTRGGQPSAYAALAGQGPTVLVEGKLLTELSKSAMDLRDHLFFADLDTKAVKRIRVTSGSQSAVLERSGEASWKMVEPKRGAAKGARVEDLLLTLSVLRWNDIVADGTDARKYGFDAPSLEVTLLTGDGAELATLVVGKREGQQAYVRAKAPTVYTIDISRLGAPPKVPDDFQG